MGVLGEEEVVAVEAADADQEHLPVRLERVGDGDDPSHDTKLRSETVVLRDRGVEYRRTLEGSGQLLVCRDRAICDHAQFVLEQVRARALEETLVCRGRGR